MEDTQKNPLGTRPIPELLRSFAIPSVIAMLVSSLYNIVDQIFIGRGVGLLGNAATNVAFPLVTICVAIALLLGIGSSANFSLALGSGDREHASAAAGSAVSLMVISGIVIFVIVRVFLYPLLTLFGSTESVLPYAATYTAVTSWGIPFLILSTGISSLIRADGSPTYSMGCMVVGAVINTILDPIFIFGFGWGMMGAALATIIGQIVSGLAALYYVFHFKTIKLKRHHFIPHLRLTGTIASLGMAGCINQLAMMLVQIVLNNTLRVYGAQSAYGAEIPLACAGIVIKVNMLCIAFVIGIAQASQPIVGYNYGAQKYARVLQTYRCAATSATVISIIAFLCFQLFPRQIIGVFGNGTESELYFQFAERFFRIYMFFTFLNGIQPVSSNFFSSIGKAFLGALLSLTRQTLFLLPLILLLPRLLGSVDGVMFAAPVADLAAFFLSVFLVYRESKRLQAKQSELQPAG